LQLKRNSKVIIFIILLIFLITIPNTLLAQNKVTNFRRNAIYVEVLGAGIAYSLNYEYRISKQIGLRAGFSSWSFSTDLFSSNGRSSFTEFPLMVNYLIGNHINHLELGLGTVVGFISNQDSYFWGSGYSSKDHFVIGTAAIGFRMEPNDGGFMFRIAFTPFFTFKNVWPFGGLSLGYAF
jgi:hypothetical protein